MTSLQARRNAAVAEARRKLGKNMMRLKSVMRTRRNTLLSIGNRTPSPVSHRLTPVRQWRLKVFRRS